MPRKNARKRLDWFKFYPSDFVQGTLEMTNEEVGAYIRLLCSQWLRMPSCCVPDRIRTIMAAMPNTTPNEWEKIKTIVLKKFRKGNSVIEGELVEVFYNARLIEERDDAKDISDNAAEAQQRGAEKRANEGANAPSNVPANEGTIRGEENKRRGDVEESTFDQTSPRRLGEYRKDEFSWIGNHPEKAIKEMRRIWKDVRGGNAIFQKPIGKIAKWWADVCEAADMDYLIPAFELWIEDCGSRYDADSPLYDFLKSPWDTYVKKVVPLKELRKSISEEQLKATTAVAKKQHEETWGPVDAKPIDDADPLSMFEETN